MLTALAGWRPRGGGGAVQRLARALASGAEPTDAAALTEMSPTSPSKRNNRMRFFVINNQPRDALDLLDRSVFGKALPGPLGAPPRFARLPPPIVCNKVLHSAAQSLDAALLTQAADLAEALSLQGVGLEGRTLFALSRALGRHGQVERALPLVDRWLAQHVEVLEDDDGARQAPLALLTHLMDAAARADEPEAVLAVLARLARVGLSPTVPSMTSLIQCFMRLGQVGAAHRMVAWMRRSALPPSAHTYTALLTLPHGAGVGHAKAVLLEAQEALQAMRSEGVQPTPYLYTALVHACSRARDLKAARAAWREMQAVGVEPDLVLFSAMIDACGKGNAPGAALELFQEMQHRGIRPDVVAFASTLAAIKASPDASAQAASVWASMREAGVRPNSFAFSAYLETALAHAGTDAALDLLAQAAQELGDNSVVAMLYAQALASAGKRVGAAAQLARHMATQGVHHTPATLGALLAVQAAQRSCSAAQWLLHAAGGYGDSGGSGAAWDLDGGIVDTCLLGTGSAEEAMQAAQAGERASGASAVGEALAILGGLAVQSKSAQAVEFNRWAEASGVELGWPGLRLSMFAALNACPPQPALVLEVLVESRRRGSGGNDVAGSVWWDTRTERAVLVALRKAPATASLLEGSASVGEGALEGRLKALLRR